MNSLLHCRLGFENAVCTEISDVAERLQVAGYAKVKQSSACLQQGRWGMSG